MKNDELPPDEHTIDERIAQIRRDETRQREACIAAIKAIHAAGLTLVVPDPHLPQPGRPRASLGRGPGAIAIVSLSGKLIGWYREGQRCGRPSKQIPLERDLQAQEDLYFRELRKCALVTREAAIRGRRSGHARRKAGLQAKIRHRVKDLLREGKSLRGCAKRIAQELKCNVEYTRRIIRVLRRTPAERS